MTRRPPEPTDPSPLHRQLIAYGACLPFLPPIRPIVAHIRQRHEIDPPSDRETLAYNLKHHPPDPLLPQVLDALRTVEWPADISFMNYVSRPELAAAWLQHHFSEDLPPDLLDRLLATIQPLCGFFLLKIVANPLARYIVVGPMELPQPLPADFVQTAFAIAPFGEPLVIAIANHAADPRQIAGEFTRTFHRTFPRPRTRRVPDQIARDAWVWLT